MTHTVETIQRVFSEIGDTNRKKHYDGTKKVLSTAMNPSGKPSLRTVSGLKMTGKDASHIAPSSSCGTYPSLSSPGFSCGLRPGNVELFFKCDAAFYGVDISEVAANAAREVYHRVDVVDLNTEPLPHDANTFDVAVALE